MSRSSDWGMPSEPGPWAGSGIPRIPCSTGAPAASPRSAPSTSPSKAARRPSPGFWCTGSAERAARLAPAVVVLAAVLVRVWHLGYGLPDVYHPDEARIVGRAIRFHAGDLNPHFFNWPSLSMYLLWAIYGAVGALGGEGVAKAFAADPARFYLIGRLVTVVFGAATVAGLYRLGRPLYGRAVALLAGTFLAVDLLHVHDSRFVTTDVPMTALVVLALVAILRYWRDGRRWDAVSSGLVIGLATSMKYPGALAGLPMLLACALRARPTRPWWRCLVRADAGLAAAGAVVGFLVGTPFAALAPAEFLRGVVGEVGEVRAVQFGNEADLPALFFHLLHSLPTAMGLPLALVALGGLGLTLIRAGIAEAIWLA